MLRTILAIALAVAASPAAARGIDPLCARVLSPVEASAVAGLQPLALVAPAQARAAIGTCNYATRADGGREVVFLVSVSHATSPKDFDQLRHVAAKARRARGIGDEAFTADGIVGFRKGNTLVSLGSLVDQRTGKPRVEEAKLVELAKLLAARI